MMSRRLWAFVRLGRPLFLVGGVVMHALGVAMSVYGGAPLDVTALVWGQIAISATQLMTHYANDYFDLEADRANHSPTRWSGGSRVLPGGGLSPQVALVAALALACIALGAALVLALVAHTGPLTLPLLAAALALAWGYSAPPLRLNARGIGEAATALIVPGLTPLVGFYLQAGHLAALPLLAIIPLACLQFAMLLAIEFPDVEGDRAAGKHTLVVRLGASRAARLYVAVLVAAYLALPLLVAAGLPSPVALAAALSAPLAGWQVWRITRGDYDRPVRWEALAFVSVALLVSTALLETLAFLLLAGGYSIR